MKRTKILVTIIVGIFVLITIFISLFFCYLYHSPIEINREKLDKLEACIKLYDRHGDIIENKKDSYVKYKDIPKTLIDAFLSIEDKRFYDHKGIDYIRILGAIKNNILYKTKQGGSTITQQLAKNIYLSSTKSYDRKIEEMRLAIKLEKEFTKEEILEKYLNMLYFGSGEYGIKNASKRFFSKSLDSLTVKECALLAGIVKSPTKYNPINNYENSIKRAELVLSLMHDQNRISFKEYEKAKNEVIVIKNDLIYNNLVSKYSNSVYFEAARAIKVDIDELPYMNLKIQTFLDLEDQNRLFKILNNKNYYNYEDQKFCALIIDNTSLGVNAFYSNFNFDINTYRRQPGSTIKPLAVFGPAINEFNYNLFTKINNNVKNFGNYTPKNYLNYYSDYESLNSCIKNSYNIPSCEILNTIGIENSIKYLNKMNIPTVSNDANLSLALGGMTYGTTFMELCSAFACIQNDGNYDEGRFIYQILDKNNNVIYKSKLNKKQIFKRESANLLRHALKGCSKDGTANKLNILPFDVASKTGTVSMVDKNYNQDAYNISFTSDITCLFWTGDKKMDKTVTGGGTPTILARDFYLDKYSTYTPEDFVNSPAIQPIYLDDKYYIYNQYILADDFAPNSTKLEFLYDTNKDELQKDNSYSNIDQFSPIIKNENNELVLYFEPNIHLNYKIIKRNLFIEKEIDQISNDQSPYSLKLDPFSQYIIIPYYFDDKNNKVYGIPYKYGNSVSIEDVVL